MNIRLWIVRGLAGMAAGVLLAAGGGCATTPSADSQPPLRVGITPNMPPLVYRQGGAIAGLEIDLANELARELGRPVRFVEVPWERQLDELRAGRTDIVMSGMTATSLRGLRAAFTDSYLEAGQMVLVRRPDLNRYLTRGTIVMTSGRVGVEKGTTGDLLVQESFVNARREVFTSPAAAARALHSEWIDLLVHDAPVIWWLAAEWESKGLAAVNVSLTSERLAWAVRPDDQELLTAVNRVLEQWKGDGRLATTVRRWIPYARVN